MSLDIKPISIERADLWYKTTESSAWIRMPSPTNDAKFNCRKLKLSGGLRLQQWNQQNMVCEAYVRLNAPQKDMSKNDIIIEGLWEEKLGYQVRSKTDNSVLGEDAAGQFPLAVSYATWTAIKISVPIKEIKTLGKSYQQWTNEACILVAESPRKTPANDTELFIRRVFETPTKESAAQEQLLKLEKGCRVKTTVLRSRRQVVVWVWPEFGVDEKNVETGNNRFAQRYTIQNSLLFKREEAGNNPIYRNATTEDWEILIVNREEDPLLSA